MCFVFNLTIIPSCSFLSFQRHPDGVASVSFRDPEEADYCIQTLDGRWFGGRQITAQAWDGTTDYQVNSATVKG
jgi:HIV Tat-specific factor 1